MIRRRLPPPPPADTAVYMTSRIIPAKHITTRALQSEAELRLATGEPVSRVQRTTRSLAEDAAETYARRRGWVIAGRIEWGVDTTASVKRTA